MKILNFVDKFLDQTPMYKLVLYILSVFILVSFLLSLLGILDYSPLSLLYSLIVIVLTTLLTNFLATKIFKLPFQVESTLITAFILFLILLPIDSLNIFVATFVASTSAILSKYLITYKNTHVFNPAAFGLFFSSFLGYGASFWWVGSIYLFPLVTIGAILLIRKVRKTEIVLYAIVANIFGLFIASYFYQIDLLTLIKSTYISGPIIFFLGFMATEPHTLPGRKIHQVQYIVFIILFPILFNLLEIYSITPEISLLLANAIFTFVGMRQRLILKLKSSEMVGKNIYEYSFETNIKFDFIPGQYAEFLLEHEKEDSRGKRRYFTISSIPNKENTISFATKFPDANMSSFKNALKTISEVSTISATQIGGDFVLPKNISQKLVFVAGGIGVTPFISHLRHILKNNEQRNVTLFYSARNFEEIAYLNILLEAVEKIDLKLILVLNETTDESIKNKYGKFNFETGYLTRDILMKYVEDRDSFEYYISGPNGLVNMLYTTLKSFEMKTRKIHTDYFPGF